MRKNTENQEKLHKKSRMQLYFAGVSLLTLVLIGIISMLPGRGMETLALGGTVTGSASDNDEFWQGISVPRNLEISQRIAVQDSATGLSAEVPAGITDKSVNFLPQQGFQHQPLSARGRNRRLRKLAEDQLLFCRNSHHIWSSYHLRQMLVRQMGRP